MQLYILASLLILLISMGYDLLHDRKLEFMMKQRRESRAAKARGSIVSAIGKAILIDIASSSPLGKCSPGRRASHLLTLWGFLLLILSILISATGVAGNFVISSNNPFMIAQLLGSLCLFAGVVWYLPQRVNVKFEGNSILGFNYSDSFILNLLVTCISFIASYILSSLYFAIASAVLFYVYLVSITLMFGLTHWTKFPHSFYKAGLFIIDRIDRERGISNLPEVAEG
jgi:hypothetical protein